MKANDIANLACQHCGHKHGTDACKCWNCNTENAMIYSREAGDKYKRSILKCRECGYERQVQFDMGDDLVLNVTRWTHNKSDPRREANFVRPARIVHHTVRRTQIVTVDNDGRAYLTYVKADNLIPFDERTTLHWEHLVASIRSFQTK